MARAYSQDLRVRVIEVIESKKMTKAEASRVFNLSRNTIDLWLKRKAETGSCEAKKIKPTGGEHKIKDWDKFREFVRLHGDKTQEEMAQLWEEPISAKSISRGLKKMGFSRKKKTYGYKERDEQKRAEFSGEIAKKEEEDLVFVDEAGMDSRDDYGYGWNEIGERFYDLKSGKRQGRTNMVAGVCNKELLAPFTVEGSFNRVTMEIWLEKCLVPNLRPGQIVIMDNASFHKGGRIEEIIKGAGCELRYLPPYSPDLNPIEKCWSWLKSRIRKRLKEGGCLREIMEAVLKEAC